MKPLILLHGALGAASQFNALKELLPGHYAVHTLDFSGHGATVSDIEDYSISRFAQDVLDYMELNGLDRVSIFGYSMGGYVALYLAKHHPEKIESVVTLATKLHWDEPTAARETGMLDIAKIEAKVPQLAKALTERHTGKDWKSVVQKTAAMLLEMGADSPLKEDDFKELRVPVTLLLGDRDKMVSLEETVAAYKILPGAKMGMLPGTPHPYEQVDVDLLCYFISKMIG